MSELQHLTITSCKTDTEERLHQFIMNFLQDNNKLENQILHFNTPKILQHILRVNGEWMISFGSSVLAHLTSITIPDPKMLHLVNAY